MKDEEELIEGARRSREETRQVREGRDDPASDDPLPAQHDPEPWAKTSSGDADTITDDD